MKIYGRLKSSMLYAYERWIRRFSPEGTFVVHNSVIMPYRWKVVDALIPGRWRKRLLRAYGKHTSSEITDERGVTEAHKRFTKPGDKVIIIAGGHGVTMTHAARIVGHSGRIDVYEGGEDSCEILKKVISLNNIEAPISLHHGIVGEAVDVYGGDSRNATTIPVSALPRCDVLELDCEGAEVPILKQLKEFPRRIIVEIHPWLFDEPAEWVEDFLIRKGYNIDYRAGHNGIPVDRRDYDELLSLSKARSDVRHVRSGARYPLVISGSKS